MAGRNRKVKIPAREYMSKTLKPNEKKSVNVILKVINSEVRKKLR
jgi:phage gpG-like protein